MTDTNEITTVGKIPLTHEEIMKKVESEMNKINLIYSKCNSNQDKALQNFLNYISDECKKKNLSDFSKVYLIYKWICLNIECDVENLNTTGKKKDLPEKIFSRRKEPISNYAILFSHIIKTLKIESLEVRGYVKGKDEKILWNIITIDNASYFIETFMGSGNIVNDKWKSEYTDYYFCPDPEEFIFSHFPDVYSKNDFYKYTLLPKHNKICSSKKEFDNLVRIKRNFFVNNFTEIIPKTFYIEPDDLNRIQIIVKYNRNFKNTEIYCHVGIEGQRFERKDSFPGENIKKDSMIIFNVPLIEKKEYEVVLFLKIDNRIKIITKQKTVIKNNLYSIKLLSPTTNEIIKGNYIDFKLEANLKQSLSDPLPYINEKFIDNLYIDSFGKKRKLKKIENYYEIKSVFILKSKIQISYYNKKTDNYNNIFKINAKNRSDGKEVSFPEVFSLTDDMVLIEPICAKLINNKKYNFKIKSKEIFQIVIINNDTTIFANKNDDDLFEVKDLEVKIRELKINYTKKEDGQFILAYKYKVE